MVKVYRRTTLLALAFAVLLALAAVALLQVVGTPQSLFGAAPDAPSGLIATDDEGEVTLTWTAPENDGGAEITKYQYRYITSATSTAWTDFPTAPATSTNQTLTGLTIGTEYTFEVRAVNTDGPSFASNGATVTPGTPLAPANLTATPGNMEVTLSWSAADDNGTTTTKYQFRQSADLGDTWDPNWGDIPGSSATTTGYTVTGLSNGTEYSFQVRAVNANGNGAPSDGANATPNAPNAPPTAVDDTATTTEDASVVINVTSNDTDPDGDALRVVRGSISSPSNGTAGLVTNSTSTIRYTPITNFNGSDSFTYTVGDGNGGTATGTVRITVSAVNDDPTLVHAISNQTAYEDALFTLAVPANTFNDVDVGDTLSYSAVQDGLSELPSWLSFSTSTVTFSGTPDNDDVGSYSITLTANDGNNGTPASDTFDINVLNTNDDPTLVHAISNQTAYEDALFTLAVPANTFNDVDVGDTLSYSAVQDGLSELPSWLSFSTSTVTFSGTPDNDDVGSYSITLTANDGNNGTPASDTFDINVLNTNDDPTLVHAISNQTAYEDALFTLAVPANTFNDVDVGDTLSYSAVQDGLSELPSWLSFSTSTVTFSGTPDNDDVGSYSITLTANDGNNGTPASDTFDINVLNTNDDPTLVHAISNQTAYEDALFTLAVPANTFNDVDVGDTLSYSAVQDGLSELPSWLSFSTSTVTFSGTPDNDDVGSYSITLTADDGNNGTPASDTFDINVLNTNDDPTLVHAISNQTAYEDALFTLAVPANTFNDVDVGDTLSYSAVQDGLSELPSWLSFSTSTVTFSGTPDNDDVGSYSITLTANDGNNGTPASDTFDINVLNTNDDPTLVHAISNQTAYEDALFTLAVPANTFNDVDVGDTLSYSAVQDGLSELPSWLSFSTSTVTFSGTPDNDDVGSYSITLTANDGNNGTPASDTFDINVLNTNDDPTLVHAISNQTAYEDALFTLAVPANTFNDVDVGDTLSYSAVQDGLSELPSWLSFSTSTVTFSGTPDNDDVGSYSITLTANDGNNGTPASDTFDINVLNTNDDPTLVHAISNQTAYEDALFTLAVPANTFNDVDVGDTLSYSAVQDGLSELPSWLSFSTSTVTFSGTPDNDDVGSYSITLTANDGNNGTPASDTFDINVLNTNDDPTLVHAISNQTAYEDALFTLAVPANTFNDVDVGDTLSYSAVQDGLSELPSWLSFSTSTVTFSGTPDNDDVGSYSITLTADDGNNGTPASDTFDINVLNTNDDPTLVHAISNQTAYEDALFTLAVPANTFNDVDVGDTLSYSAVQDGLSELPSWLSFSTSTVTFSGTPDNDDVGSYSITLTANDGNNGTPASDTFDINVLNTNDDPTLVHAISNQTAYEDALFTLAVPANTFNDVDVGDTLSYSAVQDGLSELPSWLSFSTSTVTFSGTPDNDDVGSYSITLTADDGNNGTPASDTFDINVLNTNDDPTLVHAISNQTAYEDALFTLAVPANTFNDVDVGDTLSYSAVQDGLSELPSWLSFSTSTVTFSGTPDNDDVGSYSITLTADDGNNGTPASDTFDINVLNTNDDPTLVHAISNQTAYEDALFTLAVPANTFNDVDVGDTLSYSAVQDGLSELPSWLSFSTSTVTFSGTPDNDDVGSYSITLTANDGNNGTPASDTFDINVLNTNDDPTLVHAISNQTAYEDALFTLAVPANTFNDVDVGDTLSYSAVQDGLSELPSWLSFSTSTVTFSGTPDNDDVGSYSITLTADDGNNGTPASDTFDINVLNTNDDPTLVHAISNQTAYEDALFTLAVPANTFNDVDVGDTLSYSAVQDGLSELPSWLSFSTSTVTFSGTPDNDDVGSYSITLTANDGNNGTPASDTFDINVLNTNDDPTLVHAISNQTAYEDALFTLAVPANTFNDVDVGDTLSYSAVQDGLSELPSWLSFSTSTVTFSGTPDNDDVGSYSITLTANDGNNGTPASDTFDINVLNTNDDPTLVHAISNQTAYEDALFTLAVPANTFNDVDVGDTLSYSAVQDGLSELPSWLSFSTSTVTFSGTPDNDDVGSYSITLTANDGNNGTPASDTFDINVLNTNDDPTLVHAISNQTAYEDALFTLAVPANTFNDVDVGDTLSYSAVQDGLSELPSWLSFSTSTVTFSGTPDNDDVGSYSITLTANDGNNGTPASDTFDINVLNTNDDPTLVHAISNQTAYEDALFTLAVPANTFNDVDVGDTLSYSAVQDGLSELPSWLSFSTSTVTFSGTPDNDDVGSYSITLTADDGNNGTPASDTFDINVLNTNDDPTLVHAISNQTAYEDALFTLAVPANTFNDVDVGDTLSYSAVQDGLSELPSWLSFSTSTVTFSGTPDNDDVGSYSITLTANDGNNGTPASDTFDINVLNTNDDPTLVHAISNQTAYEDALFTLAVPANTFNDVDVGDTLSYSAVQDGLSELPSWLSFSTSTVTFSGTPDNDDVGSYSITLTANDGNNGTPASDTFDINVLNTNDDPTLVHAISNQTAYEDALFTLAVPANTFNDVDVGDTLSYSAVQDGLSELPSWLSFSTSTVTFSGTPDNDDVGSYSITLTADDGNNGTPASDTFDINVLNTNDDPTLVHAISNQTAYEDALFTLAVPANTFNDVDVGDTLSYSAVQDGLSELPSWLSFSTSTVTFSGTPDNDDVGSYSITLTANDGNNGTPASDTFDINVLNTNDDPTLVHAISNQTAYEDALFTLAVPANTFNDVDVGDTLSYSAVQDGLSELPSWLSFSTSTVTFSGTPDNDDVGSYSITLTANDGNNGTPASDTFDINVLNTNDAPTLVHAISNQTAYEDALFTLAVPANTFNDVDVGDTLSYSAVQDGLSELPSWLSFSTSTVTFSGTPDNDDVGSYSITLTANDGNNGTPASDTFDINVLNTNDDPTLVHAISNQTAYEDALFTLAVPANTFNDVDVGDTLSYSAVQDGLSELPSWLSFSTSTVTFSGTPDNDDVGSYSITLTANDGNNGTPASDTFDINVLNTNDDPTLVHAISNQTAYEDALFTLAVPANTFNDVDVGDTLSYSAVQDGLSELPSWLSFSTSTVTFSGTPDNDDVGSYSITLTANDGNNGTPASDTFDINVLNTNDAPVAVADHAGVREGESVTIDVQSNDSDVDSSFLTSIIVTDPSYGSATVIDSGTEEGQITYTHNGSETKSDYFTYKVNDGSLDSSPVSVSIVIRNTNDAPTVDQGIDDHSTNEDSPISLSVPDDAFNDVDADDVLSYSASGLPANITMDSSGLFSGTPDNDDVGTHTVTVTATDLFQATASTTFDLIVVNTNDAPTVANAISDLFTNEDALFTLAVPTNTFNDVDGDSLSYSASGLPDWLSFNTDSNDPDTAGVFSGTPENQHVRSYSITLTADDGNNATSSTTFDINVLNTNDAPTVANPISNQTTDEDDLFTLNVPDNTFNDVDGDTLSYSTSELPEWLSFNTSTNVLSGTPTNDHVGSVSIRITAKDPSEASAYTTFVLTVRNTNDAPVAVADSTTVNEDTAITINVIGNDYDVDSSTLTVSAVSNATNGTATIVSDSQVKFEPAQNFHGTASFDYTVADGNGGTDTAAVTISVASINDAPVAEDDTGSTRQGTPITINVTANDSDVDGDSLSVASVGNGSRGTTSLDPDNHQNVIYSPNAGAVGSDSFTYSVSDGNGGTDQGTVNITITPLQQSVPSPEPEPTPTPVPLTVIPPEQTTPVETSEEEVAILVDIETTSSVETVDGTVKLVLPPASRGTTYQVKISSADETCSGGQTPKGTAVKCARVELFDADAKPERDVRLNSAARLEMRVSAAEVEEAGGIAVLNRADVLGAIQLFKRDTPDDPWHPVAFDLEFVQGEMVITVPLLRSFSEFALIIDDEILAQARIQAVPTTQPTPSPVPAQAPTPTPVPGEIPTPTPVVADTPPTGDSSAPTGVLLALLTAASLLLFTGYRFVTRRN